MLAAAARAFVRLGASVSVSEDGENLVRALPPTAAGDTAHVSPIPIRGEVVAQGLPNLMHELVHAVLAGRIDDDHGIDYSAIPFDLATRSGRAVLWEELSCCWLSCGYLRADCHRRQDGRDPAATADAWFYEQVDIQPVFYGLEDDTLGFVDRVQRLLAGQASEADAVMSRARHQTAAALTAAGAPDDVAQPRLPESVHEIWDRLIWARARQRGSA